MPALGADSPSALTADTRKHPVDAPSNTNGGASTTAITFASLIVAP